MAHSVKRIARGNTTKVNAYAGPAGELVMDTTTNDLVLETGTAGGVRMAKASTTISGANGVTVTAGGTLGQATTISGSSASTSAVGVVQLSNSTDGTSQTKAATEKAVADALTAAKSYTDSHAGTTYTATAPIAISSGNVISASDATTSAKGVVKVGSNISVSSGTISVADGSTSAKGVVQLSNAINSTSATLAATPKAVKDAHDDAIKHCPVPVGTIIWSGAATVPAGYLLCNGSAVGRTTYPELFAAIGTAFGSGDGSTTFNLPNLIDKFIEGANAAGTVKAAGLPNIAGSALNTGMPSTAAATATGAFIGTTSGTGLQIGSSGSSFGSGTYNFNASKSNTIYGNSATVQPPAVTALPCIKAFDAVVGDATVVAGQLVNDIQGKVALDGSNTASIGSTLSTYMAHAAMPSGQYESLSVPASGGTVTAPADGWVCFIGYVSTAGGLVALVSNNITVRGYGTANGCLPAVLMPVKKADIVTISYGSIASGSSTLRFIYANGTATA